MTIESIKRSLSATELNNMDKEAVKHTNLTAFIIKTFFESGCSIQAVKDALQERREDRLEKLFYISLRLVSQYTPGMIMPATGVPIYANVEEHTLLTVMKNQNGQDELVLWDFSGEKESKIFTRAIDDELINACKNLVENNQHNYSGDVEHAIKTIRVMNANNKTSSANKQEFVNFVEREMVSKYGVFFWQYATEIAEKREQAETERAAMCRNNNNCIMA